MRQDANWIDRVVDSLSDDVYITIDCDGFDPAIMPAVGTPEPGGLGWYEGLALLRRVIERRRVVGCDIVELCPMPGNVAPSFLCARLLYKILIVPVWRGDQIQAVVAQAFRPAVSVPAVKPARLSCRTTALGGGFLQRFELALRVRIERRIRKLRRSRD